MGREFQIRCSPNIAVSCRLNVSLMDGQALDFQHQFDAVFSHAAMHWMPDHDAVFKVECSI